MWNDVETTTDLLNFKIVADIAASLIEESGDEPVSIGVSGSWGSGKSSLVKMIGKSLETIESKEKDFIFIEFNAWLYQGYDDARIALLQSVADKLLEEAKTRKTYVEKAKSFMKRVEWLKLGRLAAPVVAGAFVGGSIGGPVGAVVGAVGGLFKADGVPPTEADINKIKEAYTQLSPELGGLLKIEEAESLPKEIAGLRDAFEDILKNLNVTLVLLVDDLDRCLPNTAISTLEAMRLLLFLPRTAFIIAADEEMIRNAVRAHFGNANINDDLVTSYFDKLIQIPLRVPRLGVTEVKAYLTLLLADLAVRRGEISQTVKDKAQKEILEEVKTSWSKGLSPAVLSKAFGSDSSKMTAQIDLADQLAVIMVTADHISGNPRLIKRFLNDLLIRDSIAKAQGIVLPFETLVKMQLFERCASPAAFEFLAKKVAESDDGKPSFIQIIEAKLTTGEEYQAPDKSWDTSFVSAWLKIKPTLAEVDLRPLLHLSRDRSISLASYDEMSKQSKDLLSALFEVNNVEKFIITQIKEVGEVEAGRILSRLIRRARRDQFDLQSIKRALNVPKAFPNLASQFIGLLAEIPATNRPAALIPLIKEEDWAKDVLVDWAADSSSPQSISKAIINQKGDK